MVYALELVALWIAGFGLGFFVVGPLLIKLFGWGR